MALPAVLGFEGLQGTLDLRAPKDQRARKGLTALCVARRDLPALLPSPRNPLLRPPQPRHLTNQKNRHQQHQHLTNQKNRQQRHRRHP
jgi:hypothetical protein